MIDQILTSLQASSRITSALGQAELAQHQECAIQALGFAKMDGQVMQAFAHAQLKPLESDQPLASRRIASAFALRDVLIGIDEEKAKAVLLFFVESDQVFDGVPLFWQNYLAHDSFPAVFLICIEKMQVQPERFEYLALPYFSILNLSADYSNPTISFVGKEIREKAIHSKDEAFQDAMSNIGLFLPIANALICEGQEQ